MSSNYRISLYWIIIATSLILGSCHESTTPQFQLMNDEQTGIRFTNEITATNEFNVLTYRNFFNGGGVGIGDINNDGLADIYLIGNMGPNKLFLNKGHFQFEDITNKAGLAGKKDWCTGVTMVDINADGFLDIYVTNAGTSSGESRENELFINNQDLTFTESAAAYQLNDPGISTHAAFFDYDLDGDLDAYILNNSFISVTQLNYNDRRELYAKDWHLPDSVNDGGDKLLRNENGKYIDVSKESGIYGSLIGFGLGITVGDVNADHYPDIYVSNDFYERDYLYINQRDGTFKEDIMDAMGHISLSSMGADMADINNDGFPEIFVTDMLAETDERVKQRIMFEGYNTYLFKKDRGFHSQYVQNTLQLNNGNGTFSEIAWYSGVAASDWSWGALFFDGDNDGLKDLFISNGVLRDMTDQDFVDFFANDELNRISTAKANNGALEMIERMPSDPLPNKYFKNMGKLDFDDIGNEIGFATNSFSNGSAYGDLDNDGDLDLVVNNVNQPAFVYKNNLKKTNHFISIRLKGDSLNTFAIGSSVKAYIDTEIVYAELIPSRGFQSSVDYKLLLGLGTSERVDSLDIKWPNGQHTRKYDLTVDSTYSFEQLKEGVIDPPTPKSKPTLLTEIENDFKSFEEDYYFDFFYEGLIAKMSSQNGPDLDIADVNSDGLDDLFIGGTADNEGVLYIQKAGEFVRIRSGDISSDLRYEDTAVKFFDADGDRDMDLMIGSGGNISTLPGTSRYDRLYLNDGTGIYKRSESLPNNPNNTSTIIPLDFDDDGDQDLLIGNESVAGVYGPTPSGFLWENDGTGRFTDVTATYFSELNSLGMITDGLFVDLNNDARNEIILIGEWMAPRAFTFKEGKFQHFETGLEALAGWWYSIESTDLDNDGDLDLIIGNLGENAMIQASKESPVRLWIKDFDNNETIEKILTKYIDGKDKPYAPKSEIAGQLPFLKKKNLKHTAYSTRGMRELFDPELLLDTEIKEASWFKSIVAINDGDGKMTIQTLPMEAQLSCICDILCIDLNNDGLQDIVLGGNDDTYKPQFSKLDASYGLVLLNDDNGGFKAINAMASGFHVSGEIKQISTIGISEETHLLVVRNEEKPKLFKLGIDSFKDK
ncbi:MAG: VCBS repeat-containing protein [Cyclobacteriaceae bacterium]